jgi:hypothetical protein
MVFPLNETNVPETPPPANQIVDEVEALIERILKAQRPMLNFFDLNC